MKKYLTILFSVLLGLSACVEENLNNDKPDLTGKLAFSGKAVLVGSDDFSIQWEATKDKIGVFAIEGEDSIFVNKHFYAYSSTTTTSFVDLANELIDGVDGKVLDIHVYFPFRSSFNESKEIPCKLDARQVVKEGEMVDIKNNILLYDSQKQVKVSKGDTPDVLLKPAMSFIKLNATTSKSARVSEIKVSSTSTEPLAFDSGFLNIETGELTVMQPASSELTLVFEEGLTLTPAGVDLYFAITPGHAGKKLSLTTQVGSNEVEIAVLDIPSGGLEAGRLYSYTSEYEFPIKVFTNLSAAGTANTYIVNKKSTTYGFNPKVKGNGVVRDFSWTFDGQPCDVSFNNVDINPAEVKLLWYNTPKAADGQWENISPIVIESVEYDDFEGYVYFQTPETFVEGTAMIAAFDGNGEILWSWTIWAVENYNPEATARQAGRFVVMDRNLGAYVGVEAAKTSNELVAAHSIGHFYQWGRKDPTPARVDFSANPSPAWGLPTYTPIAEYQKEGGKIFTENRVDNIYCIGKEVAANFTFEQARVAAEKNPHKFLCNGTSDNLDPYNWVQPPYSGQDAKCQTTPDRVLWRTLWGSTDGYNSVKTIYDPCPVGWKVPTADLFMYLGPGSTKTTYGIYSSKYDIFLPAAGQRNAGFGGSTMSGVGVPSYVTASVTAPYQPMRGDNSGIAVYNVYGGAAYQLRCVKEEVLTNVAPVGQQDGPRAVLMGDSITETWPFRGRNAFFTENDFVGKGISGQTTMNMIGRFYADALALNPLCIVVAGGTNDLAYNNGWKTCREDITNNVRIMIELARAWGAEVIVGSAFPSHHYWWNYNGTTPKSFWNLTTEQTAQGGKELEILLRAYAESNGYAYANYYEVLRDDNYTLKEEYCYPLSESYGTNGLDYVHPNANGFAVMEPVLKPLVDHLLNDAQEGKPGNGSLEDMGKEEWN